MLTLSDGRSELWQWDTGRKLTVDAECSQVHFSNKVFGRSVDVDVVDGVAVIPDILLQTDKDLNVWAFVGTPENGYTKISKVFKVNKRSKPADYVFTPPEQTTLEEIKEKLDYLESIQDPDAIKNAVDEYLANNPIQIDEKDPTVPNWAKQTTKPKYTATEVGAVAKVNGMKPDANGNVEITIPDSGGNVDLSITGATAGQTVKISAVDKNGVPTAWEAVEFPSNGGQYELIDTIVSEDSMLLTLMEEPDGTPYNFSALLVVFECSEEATEGFNCYIEYGGQRHPVWVEKFTANTTNAGKIAYVEGFKERGKWKSRYRQWTTENYITGLQESLYAYDVAESITGFLVRNPMSAGVKISIYGVRA